MTVAIVVVAVLMVLVLPLAAYVITTYNRFVRTRELWENAKSQIAVQMETRWDALTSLIAATKQYADYEASTLEEIVQARSAVRRDAPVEQLAGDQQAFDGALAKIQAVAEAYPELKASGVYQQTMTQVAEYEDNIRMSRMVYNDTTTKFNRQVVSFPSSVVASMFGFTKQAYFEMDAGKSSAPTWS